MPYDGPDETIYPCAGLDRDTEPSASRYIVAIYMRDMAYGGPEEGGWYYDCGEHIRTIRAFKNEERACAYARRFNHWLDLTLNADRREISSVLSEGRYDAQVWDDFAPYLYPATRPHYE